MPVVANHSGLPHRIFEKQGPEGAMLDVLVVRGTFDLKGHDQALQAAPVQRPIGFGDLLLGAMDPHPLRAVMEEEGDLVVFKPGTDVTVSGPATAPLAHPQPQWHARLSLGPIQKGLRLSGPRRFRRRWSGWKLDPASPVAHVMLDDRLAYGWCFELAGEDGEPLPLPLTFAENPAGCGWLPPGSALRALSKAQLRAAVASIKALDEVSAPQIEAPEDPVVTPGPEGCYRNLSARPRWVESRRVRQGTTDAAWARERHPQLPRDFDPAFYQCAPADQVCRPWLSGNELLTLEGLLPEPLYRTQLPGLHLLVVARAASGLEYLVQPVLDTVRVDLARGQLTLLWRAHFARLDPVLSLTLGATDRPLAAPPKSRTRPDGADHPAAMPA